MRIERYRPFCKGEEDIILKNILRKEYISKPTLRQTEVDIIMPTFNRSQLLEAAINSIFSQLHQRWTLYVCDDGSSDSTPEVIKAFEFDNRIKYLRLPHRGVSHARNAGLKQVRGEFISFLDSDNTWDSEYLSLMVAFVNRFSLDCAYCAAKLIGDIDQQWLGDSFNWQACVECNYVDLNCFITTLANKKFLFDENLQRFVDWDYILAVTKTGKVSYFPAPLVEYCNKQTSNRITTSVYQGGEHIYYINSIRDKHRKLIGRKNNIDVRYKEGMGIINTPNF